MILVTGTVKVQEGNRDAMSAAVEKMVAATRQEDGCLDIRYGYALDDDHTITFHEVWASPEAARAHGQTPHMAEFGPAMMPLIDGPPQATMWDAEQLAMG